MNAVGHPGRGGLGGEEGKEGREAYSQSVTELATVRHEVFRFLFEKLCAPQSQQRSLARPTQEHAG